MRLESAVFVGSDLLKTSHSLRIPFPGVHKRLNLGSILRPDVGINLVVIALGVEGRINVAEVHGFILDVLAKYVKVIAVEEEIVGGHIFRTD